MGVRPARLQTMGFRGGWVSLMASPGQSSASVCTVCLPLELTKLLGMLLIITLLSVFIVT